MSARSVGTSRVRLWFTLLVCFGLGGGAWAQAAEKKYALLVGLNKYLYPWAVPQLQFAVNDARELKDVLEKQGWEVTLLLNEDARRERVVAELYRHAWVTTPNDDFILYFAGHGVRNRFASKQAFWLTYDAHMDSLDVGGIRLHHLLEYIGDIPAGRKLLLLDHCFSGDLVSDPASVPPPGPPAGSVTGAGPPPAASSGSPPAGGGGARDASGATRLERNVFPVDELRDQLEVAGEGSVVVAAAAAGALELGDLRHGVFTWVLLRALTTREADTNSDARLSIDELKAYLQAKVVETARSRANVEQRVLDLGTVRNSASWLVSENLPLGDLAEVRAKTATYKTRLGNWYQQGLIKQETKLLCWELLLVWEGSLGSGRPLTAQEEVVLAKLRETLEGTSFERARADDLETFVAGLPK
jgi:hypothetical protein